MSAIGGVGKRLLFLGMLSPLGPVEKRLGYYINQSLPPLIPEREELTESHIGGFLSDATHYVCGKGHGAGYPVSIDWYDPWRWVYQNGVLVPGELASPTTDDPWVAQYWSHVPKLSIDQAIRLSNRGGLSPDSLRWIMQAHGWRNRGVQDVLYDLSRQIPSPSMILDMSLRGAFDPSLMTPDTLLAEYDPAYQYFANWSGLGAVQLPGNGPNGNVPTYDFAQGLWALHWRPPSLAEANNMERRLRPTGGISGGPRDPSGLVWTSDMWDMVMRSNNIHPQYRAAYQAILTRPIDLRRAGILYQYGVIDKQEIYEIALDNDYNTRDAQTMAEGLASQVDHRIQREIEGQARGSIERAWSLGTIDDATYVQLLMQHGLTQDQADRSFAYATLTDQEQYVGQIVRTYRTMYIRGEITSDDVLATLSTVGIVPNRVQRYVAIWDLELRESDKHLSAGQILKAARDGLLPPTVVAARLHNLRYDDDYIATMLSELQLYLDMRAAKELEKVVKAKEKQEKALIAAQKAAESALQKSRAALARHGTPKQLAKWLVDNLIDPTEAVARLNYLGWPNDDITRLVAEAKPKIRPTKPAKKPPVAKPPKPSVKKDTENQILRWLKDGIVDDSKARQLLMAIGVSSEDIDLVMKDFYVHNPPT